MKKDKFEVVNLNSYIKPDPHTLLTQTGKHVTNGTNNEYFYYVEDRYLGSPTNSAIIDGYANYIFGEGLLYEGTSFKIEDILDEENASLAVRDLKMQGACVFQVVYTKEKDKKIAKLYYLPTKTIAINKQARLTDDIESYWYCFDWMNKSKFEQVCVPAFGYGKENESEILYIKIPSPQPLFSLPDYQSGLQYCEMEEEMSNFSISNIKNNFSIGKLINVNEPIEESDDALEDAEQTILNKVKGTSNAGGILVSFNRNKDNATTIENIEVTNAYEQFSWISDEATKKIMLSHKVNDPSLFGLPLPSGFSSQAEQTIQSLKVLYRNQINPLRRIFLRGLEKALKINDPQVKLSFKDFEDFNATKTETAPVVDKLATDVPVSTDNTNLDSLNVFDAKTLDAQAALKGSVGGVTALLQIQNSYSQGLTDRESAITMLKVIFGYDDTTANDLLGQPKKEETV